MKKQHNPKFGALGILIGILILLGVAYGMVNKNTNLASPNVTQEQTKTYQSRSLRFSIVVPNSVIVKEGQTFVDLSLNDNTIDIVRNGTNFSSLKDYLNDFDSRKDDIVTSEKDYTIDGYQANGRIESSKYTNLKQAVYYIYVDNWVYAFSTSSEVLYKDLDQIVRTFKYTP